MTTVTIRLGDVMATQRRQEQFAKPIPETLHMSNAWKER